MMANYLLESSIALVALYPLYRLVLLYESNHQLRRLLGLFFLLFSTVILHIPIENIFEPFIHSNNIQTIIRESSDVQAKLSTVTMTDSYYIYLIIYLVGVCVFSIHSLVGLITLFYFYYSSKRYRRWGFKVVEMKQEISPFSFFNILFIGNQIYEKKKLDVIIAHEQFHRDQFHSMDAIILEVLTILFWFNPAIWLFKRDIKEEHEFLADAHVIKNVINRLDYQQLLFESRAGVSIPWGNYLSKNISLTKRFKMMTHKKTNSNLSFMRITASVTVMLMMIFLSSFTGIDYCIQADVPAMYKEGDSAMYNTLYENLKYPKISREENRSGLVYISFTVDENGDVKEVTAKRKKGNMLDKIVVTAISKSFEDEKGIDDAIKLEAIQAVNQLGKFIPAQDKGKAVSSTLIFPIQFKLTQ